jgi:hypothetical protein
VHTVFVKLFTRDVLTDPERGRTLVRLTEEYVPSWLPHRYGWSVPLRNVYDADQFEDFWTGLEYGLDWRNAKRTASGHVTTRVGPRDSLSSITLSGEQTRALDLAALAELLQESARALDLVYGVLALFQPDDLYTDGHGGHLVGENQGTPFLAVQERGLKECLPDLAWGNVFGAPYVELFGGPERVRSVPAARVTELGPEQYYLQLTGDITDVQQNRPAFTAAREAAKQYLGADCFAGYPGPLRAPRLPMAVEEGLWSPPAGFDVPDDLRAMLDQAVSQGKTLPPPSGVIEKGQR